MNIRTMLLMLIFLSSGSSYAQNKLPANKKADNSDILWMVKEKKTLSGFGTYYDVDINRDAIQQIYQSQSTVLTIPFVTHNGVTMYADVFLKETEDIRVKINNREYKTGLVAPKMFSGKVRGLKETNNVLVTLAPGFLNMNIYLSSEKISIERNTNAGPGKFMLQYSGDIIFKRNLPGCEMGVEADQQQVLEKQALLSNTTMNRAASDKCTYIFIDCTTALYVHESSDVQTTVNYVYAIWNDVNTLYENEQMHVKIAEINVWTVEDPFVTSASAESANRSFADYYQNNFWGNMALLLDWSDVNGGIAGGFGKAKSRAPNVCGTYDSTPNPSYNIGSYAYCNLDGDGTYQNFPVSENDWQVNVCAHELGHLFGSWHTHSCNWPSGPIDNCFIREGSCNILGNAPVNGGTIMSYCHLSNTGINYNNGFGPLPGNLIRNWVSNYTCIANCGSCNSSTSVGTIVTQGFYHYEASVFVTANGNVPNANTFIKLDAGTKVTLAPGFKALEGSKLNAYIDGCGGIR